MCVSPLLIPPLQITLYNGWQFTSSPVIGYLEKVSPSTRASLRSSGYGPRNNLVLRGSLEVTDIIPHPLVEVVLQLEYVVSWSGVAMVTGAEGTTRSRRKSSIGVGHLVMHKSTQQFQSCFCWCRSLIDTQKFPTCAWAGFELKNVVLDHCVCAL